MPYIPKPRPKQQQRPGNRTRGPDRAVRSSHLGYDCYATGRLTVASVGKVRCLLRSRRLPPHITQDILSILPVEMWWPEKDHGAAHAMIDAVVTFDLKSLASWKSLWPQHDFGYETFMQLAERHLTVLNAKTLNHVRESQKYTNAELRTDPGMVSNLPKPSLFPCKVVSVEPVDRSLMDGYSVTLAIVRFEDGSAALRVSIRSPSQMDCLILSRAYVDLKTGQFEVIEHYPGRYKGLGLSPQTLLKVLGIKRPVKALGRRLVPKAPEPVLETVPERASRITTAIMTGDPEAEYQPPPPEQEVDLTVFPAAPGCPR